MSRLVGLLFSAAAVRLASMALAIYVAVTVGGLLTRVFAHVDAAMGAI